MRHREEERERLLLLIPLIGVVYLIAWIIYEALTAPELPDPSKEVNHATKQ